jgi:hypothetical protein
MLKLLQKEFCMVYCNEKKAFRNERNTKSVDIIKMSLIKRMRKIDIT